MVKELEVGVLWVFFQLSVSFNFSNNFNLSIYFKIEEDAAEAGKQGYVNFKHVVWHESFYQLIKDMTLHAKSGFYMRCGGESVDRWLFPIILILSADYEEQYVLYHYL